LRQRDFDGAVEVLHHALRDEHEREHERQRQQHVQCRTRQVDPEVADAVRLLANEAADHRHQHGHAGGGGKKVLHVQAEHLGQVAHRRFAAVALPVGVGGEAHRGVEGGIG
jgi:hypothetical protein